MRRWIGTGIGLIALGLLGCAHQSPPPSAPAAIPIEGSTGQIVGAVLDTTLDEPASASLVILQSSALSEARETQTNDDGLYAFRDLPPGTYTVQALYGAADVSRIVTIPGPVRTRVDFQVDPDFIVHCCCCVVPYEPWASMLEPDEKEDRLMGNDPPVFHPPKAPARL